MKLDTIIERKIKTYDPAGNLDHTARLILSLLSFNYPKVEVGSQRVALLSEAVAKKLKRDAKYAFFGGLLHDTAKLILPPDLFNGRDISEKEYQKIKIHAIAGFIILKEFHLLVALCAGLHHKLYDGGYGIEDSDFPKDFPPHLKRKVLGTAIVVSICDFIEANKFRGTKAFTVKKSTKKPRLKAILYEKFPEDRYIVDIAIKECKEMFNK